MKNEVHFNFKDLIVWQKALDFADDVINITENLNSDHKHYRLIEQLEASTASVAQNIAEGKGRFYAREYIRFLYIARASLYESITLLNLFQKRNWITADQLTKVENQSFEIANMIKGLINSLIKRIGNK